MSDEISKLKTDIYEIEASLAQQQYMIEIIKDYGEYNSECSDGVDKMTYLINIMYKQHIVLREKLDDFIPRFQKHTEKWF